MELPQPGDTFEGRYHLHEILGEGGFAVVYTATDQGQGARRVAVKVLRPDAGESYRPDVEPRFAREVRMLSQLRSPHTVQLLHHGKSAAGLLYLVFEHVEGKDLDELIEQRELSIDDVVQVIRRVAEALHEAHSAGLLHRDIKPGNIRVRHTADALVVKLLDFGIAKPIYGAHLARLTKTGEMLGTPRYMSPEQLTEDALSPASDIYSLGIVAYEMLTGGQIHGARWTDQLDRLHSGHVFSVPELERIGPQLNAIVERMSARRPEDRYQSAADLIRALDDLEGGETLPERARPTVKELAQMRGAVTTIREVVDAPMPDIEYKDSPRPRLAVVAFGFALVLVAVAATWLLLSPNDQNAPPPQMQRTRRPAAPLSTPPPPVSKVVEDTSDAVDDKPSPGCGLEPPFDGTGVLERMFGLSVREWAVHVPADYDPERPYPSVVLFHADVSGGRDIIAMTKMGELADAEGFVVIAPEDTQVRAWQGEGAHHKVKQILAAMADDLCLDPRRVYLVGHGLGGTAVESLSCEPWVAGTATNAYRREHRHCTPERAVPFVHFAPTKSIRIPVEGGRGCRGMMPKPSLERFEDTWRTRNGCEPRREEWKRLGNHTCYTWDCEQPFVSCHLQSGYDWPGSGRHGADNEIVKDLLCRDDVLTEGFDGSRVAWDFLRQQELSDEAPTAW